MNVLVTGASGFLGSHIAERLSARGDRVRVLLRKTSKRKHLENLPGVEFFEGDVEQVDRVREAVDGMDAVIHSAGLVKARSKDEFFAVNVGGTSNLVHAARTARVKRFAYVSSLEACGPSPDGTPVPVDQENPFTTYGRSKLSAEKVVLSAKDAMGVTILRPAGIYGPRDQELFAMFQSIRRGFLPLVAGGSAKGCWVYGPDCAEACIRAVVADVPSGGTYFVDDGCGALDQKQLLLDTEQALGKHAFLRASLPAPILMTIARGLEVVGRLSNKPVMLTREKAQMLLMHWVCSSEATRRDLGWEPKVPWQDGIALTAKWYLDNGWL
ncbi:MAG TPA: NAD(P)-dependent oxidoreductase [Polyangiaceae bacterium]|jgi:nucleoside-diphosphate-sugar epimerase|nr:NAD(P)-dependent oxidoreductase [Polyangiaceae bacterium]